MPEVKGTALVVEPDAEFARRLVGVLEELGFTSETVRAGDAAATKLVNRAYDVVVTELALPGLDGFNLVQAIRSRYSRAQTRVFVVSGFVAQRTLASERKDQLGIDAVIARNGPIDAALRTLRRALANANAATRTGSVAVVPASSTPLPFAPPSHAAYDTAAIPTRSTLPEPPPPPSHAALQTTAVPLSRHEQVDFDLDDDVGAFDGEELELEELQPVKEARDAARLRAIEEVGGVDHGPPDPELQKLIADVAREFDVDMALITFMLADQQWYKAYAGIEGQLLEDRGIARDKSFCKHIVDADIPTSMVVADAAINPAFNQSFAVKSGLVRSYAGAPLVTSKGQVLGTLCLADKRPQQFDADDVDRLNLVAKHVAGLIELRAASRRGEALEAQLTALVQDSHRVAARWIAILDHLDTGIVLMNAHDRTVMYANAAFAGFFGLRVDDVRGLTREQLMGGIARLARNEADFRQAIAVPAQGAYAGTAVLEMALPRRRLLRWQAKPIEVDGMLLQMAMLSDVTAEIDLARTREREARTDALTGLANRRGFAVDVAREVARSRRTRGRLWVAMIDIDRFKHVNDVHGHSVGDTVLVAVANTIRKSLRTIDIVARRGGEEFVALLTDVDDSAAGTAAERVRRNVANLKLPTGSITVSIGIAPVEAFDVEAAIAVADGRLYEAKKAGRNVIVGASAGSGTRSQPMV